MGDRNCTLGSGSLELPHKGKPTAESQLSTRRNGRVVTGTGDGATAAPVFRTSPVGTGALGVQGLRADVSTPNQQRQRRDDWTQERRTLQPAEVKEAYFMENQTLWPGICPPKSSRNTHPLSLSQCPE